ncbi:hypothetical protein [[Limnothrix rosea] IAM M-220]|uniref:hypothetical protein n=1 Tax=[Limnothrix rosea] IAM M-220 TaxID=454133 RepID=UPI00095D0DEA|nr:hypothetical protein [[Limnothrix rosea] IAM M-220]OKH15125.1 hypothetical protein NIES208_13090 [[Limnothrix rosea] IAM M-220]
MQLLEAFRHFLFPFDQEILETPTVSEKTRQCSGKTTKSLQEKGEKSREFIALDGFLYLNNL